MHRIRVGVLRGGPSNEYEISLKTGATVLSNLEQEKYNPRDIFIDREGNWHVSGRQIKPHDALNDIDVVFNALHGHYGEDGKVQHLLEVSGIPFTGSGSFASAISMNKLLSKDIYKKEKIKTPRFKIIESISKIKEGILDLIKAFSLPVIVKPVSSGSSVGITIVQNFPSFEWAIRHAFEHDNTVFIEEFIKGKEASCGVINNFRNQEYYALPPIEIQPHEGRFFDYEAKYKGKSNEIVPGNFTQAEKKEIERLAILAHQALGLRHYSRSDFIIHPQRGIFILESNTLPGLTEESLIPKSLQAVGSPLPHFLDHIIQLALSEK